MQAAHYLVHDFLPNVLQSVPIPKTFGGLTKLSGLFAFDGVLLGLGYAIYSGVNCLRKGHPINDSIDKNLDKIVHTIDCNSINEKKVYCRCWKSEKFPFCDGSHNKHNTQTGDNVGPLILNK